MLDWKIILGGGENQVREMEIKTSFPHPHFKVYERIFARCTQGAGTHRI